MEWLWWSLVSVASWGTWGVVVKFALQGLAWPQLFVFSTATLVAVAALVLVAARPVLAVPTETLLPAIVASLLGSIGTITLYVALTAGGRASVVIPLTAAYPVVTAALSVAILREGVDATKVAAVVLFVAATVLAAR